jgi:hypothetical protein
VTGGATACTFIAMRLHLVKPAMGTEQMLWALLANKQRPQSRCVTGITGSKFVLNY